MVLGKMICRLDKQNLEHFRESSSSQIEYQLLELHDIDVVIV